MRCRPGIAGTIFAAFSLLLLAAMVISQPVRLVAADEEKKQSGEAKKGDEATVKPAASDNPTPTNPADPTAPLRRLLPEDDVWIDPKNKQIVIEGEVCLTRGLLEMFACLKGSKEHESVVAANAKAYPVHAALLALGAKSGSPAKFDPKYVPASGTPIDVMVYWTDDKGQPQKAKAQDWVRDIKTQKPMGPSWVFAGSAFHHNEVTGKNIYIADAYGDFICVSNFPSALLDIPVESSQENAELAFEANTEKIPPRGTKVKIVLMPKIEKQAAGKLNRRDAEAQRETTPKSDTDKK
jgi:hypothetical protein